MKFNINNLDATLIDILKEIGNIGSGNAATALAKILDKKVDMKVPKVNILDFNDIPEILGGAEETVVGIYFLMEGDVLGNIMFMLNVESAKNLVDIIFNRVNSKEELDEMDISALSEIGNILAASYVNSLSVLTKLNFKISIPSTSIDMAGAILSVPAIHFGQHGDKVLFIETEFLEGEKLVSGDLFLIPDIESYETLLKSLGVSYDEFN